MDWNQELLKSALWMVKAFAVTLVVFGLGMAALARFTAWGRQFWSLSGGYFSPRRSWRPLLAVALILFFVLLSVRMNVLFSFWYNDFYTAMQKLDETKFWFCIRLFTLLATLHVLRALLNAYIQGAFSIRWREWLNGRLLAHWVDARAYYLGRHVQPQVDNPDQRIQVDATSLVSSTLGLSMGLVSAVVSVIEFTGILWNLSAPLPVMGHELPRAMVFLVYLYVIVATVFAVRIGRPLIQLNFLNEKLGATYRYLLVRLREYGESVAFYRGEPVEKRTLLGSFAAVIRNAWALLWRGLMFDGYNLAISQAAVVFPIIIQAPRLFSKAIQLGDVMQTTQAFGQVEGALSYVRQAYDSFATYRAVLDRLSGFERNAAEAAALVLPQVRVNPQALVVQGLDVARPDGQVLTQGLDLHLSPGQALLIRGPSGAGKTTLLRTLAGLWPYARGCAERPGDEATLFLSQKPYLPVGSLRTALAYPGTTVPDAQAREVLHKVQLGHLEGQLDTEQDWLQILSPGEQQRLSFGRVLVNRPAILFLDEATSATDAGLEHALYALMRRELPQAMLVSVGHRETLLAFHDQVLTLARDGRWTLAPAAPA